MESGAPSPKVEVKTEQVEAVLRAGLGEDPPLTERKDILGSELMEVTREEQKWMGVDSGPDSTLRDTGEADERPVTVVGLLFI